jgi:hypothetical protein
MQLNRSLELLTPPSSNVQPLMEEDDDCPLCMEEMDPSDHHFKPCPCGYQVCRFCWHRLREQEEEGKCPACRRVYTEEAVQFTPIPPEELDKVKQKKKASKERRESQGNIIAARKHLSELRVVQKNLIYVIGISMRIADEQILMQSQFFGQFGKITKIVVNKKAYGSGSNSSASAYITFTKNDDAARAIECVDGSVYDERVLRATYGTTKYCSFFLRGLQCSNSECLYLHELGEEICSFTKEQLNAGKHNLHSFVIDQKDSHSFKKFGQIMIASNPTSPPPPTNGIPSPSPPSICSDSSPPVNIINSSSPPGLDVPTENSSPSYPLPLTGLNYTCSHFENFFERIKRWNQSDTFLKEEAFNKGGLLEHIKDYRLPIGPPSIFDPFDNDPGMPLKPNALEEIDMPPTDIEPYWTRELLAEPSIPIIPPSRSPSQSATSIPSTPTHPQLHSSLSAVSRKFETAKAKAVTPEPIVTKKFTTSTGTTPISPSSGSPKIFIKTRSQLDSPSITSAASIPSAPSPQQSIAQQQQQLKALNNRNLFNLLEPEEPVSNSASSSDSDEQTISPTLKTPQPIPISKTAITGTQQTKRASAMEEPRRAPEDLPRQEARNPLANVLKMKKPGHIGEADRSISELEQRHDQSKDEVKLLEDQLRVSMASLIQSFRKPKY